MSSGPQRPPPVEIPDLDVAPLPTSRKRTIQAAPSPDLQLDLMAAQEPAQPSRGARARPTSGDLTFDTEDPLELLPLGALELESTGSMAAVDGAAAGLDVSWPALTTGLDASVSPSDDLVEACVPWGVPPKHVLAAVVYAFWVFHGKQRLARQLKAQSTTARELEHQRNAVAVEYVDKHRHLFEGDARYAPAQSRLAEIEAHANAETAQYARPVAPESGALQELERRIETHKEAIDRLTKAIEQHKARLNLLETDCERRRARRKRLDIEARSGQLGEVDHARACLEEESAIAQCLAELARVRAEVTRLEQDRLRLEFEVRGIQDETTAQIRQIRTREAASEAQLRATMDAAMNAKLDLLRTAVAHRDRLRLLDSVRLELLALEEPLTRARLRLAAIAQAQNAFDRRRVKQGLQLLIACIALLLLPILLSIWS